MQILSQNTRGFNDEKEEMVLALMQQKNIFPYAVQETWKRGDVLYEKYGYLDHLIFFAHHPEGFAGVRLMPRASVFTFSGNLFYTVLKNVPNTSVGHVYLRT